MPPAPLREGEKGGGDSGVCLIQQSVNRLFSILRASVSLW